MIPASPALPPGQTADWGIANTVRVQLTTPFLYAGGDLCLEIQGNPTPPSTGVFWLVDCEWDPNEGAEAVIGTSCTANSGGGKTAGASPLGMRIGATASFHGFGRPSTNGLLLFGTQEIPNGIDLSFLGAPGCYAWITPVVGLATTYRPVADGFVGMDVVTLFIPVDPSLMQATFVTQWVNIEPQTNSAGFTMSNAVRSTVSAFPPGLGACVITSAIILAGQPLPDQGEVDQSRSPVLQILAQ